MKKERHLSVISDYPLSLYNDDAMLNLGIMYLNEDRQDESVSLLSKLINKHPKSTLVKTALLKIGLNFYNQNMSDSAYIISNQLLKVMHIPKSLERL